MNRSSEIYKVAKRLIKRFGTRNPKEIAKQLGIVIMYSDELGDLLGLYTNIANRHLYWIQAKNGLLEIIERSAQTTSHFIESNLLSISMPL